LDKGVFKSGNPEKVAHSLERSAATSQRKKGTAYQSAMSMLNFYINRAGKNLPASKKRILEKAKEILKEDHEKSTTRPNRAAPKETPARQSANPAKKTRTSAKRSRTAHPKKVK